MTNRHVGMTPVVGPRVAAFVAAFGILLASGPSTVLADEAAKGFEV